LWLVGVIALVLVFRQSFENRSILRSNIQLVGDNLIEEVMFCLEIKIP